MMPKRVVTMKEVEVINKMLCAVPHPDYEIIASKMKLSVSHIKRMHTVVRKDARKQREDAESVIGGH